MEKVKKYVYPFQFMHQFINTEYIYKAIRNKLVVNVTFTVLPNETANMNEAYRFIHRD